LNEIQFALIDESKQQKEKFKNETTKGKTNKTKK